jgi:hypothetical protein
LKPAATNTLVSTTIPSMGTPHLELRASEQPRTAVRRDSWRAGPGSKLLADCPSGPVEDSGSDVSTGPGFYHRTTRFCHDLERSFPFCVVEDICRHICIDLLAGTEGPTGSRLSSSTTRRRPRQQ